MADLVGFSRCLKLYHLECLSPPMHTKPAKGFG